MTRLIKWVRRVNFGLCGVDPKITLYYMSKRLLDAKTKYPELEKLALALMVTSRKLRQSRF